METLELKDFLSYGYPSAVTSAGSGALFIVARANEKKNSYDRDLFLARDGKVIQLTHSGDASAPVYHDERAYMILKRTEDDGKSGWTSIYSIPLAEPGEAELFLRVNEEISSFDFLPDGNLIVRYEADARFDRIRDKEEIEKRKKEIRNYEEIEEAPFYFNGAGFRAFGYSRLGVLDIGTGKLRSLTPVNYGVGSWRWTDEKRTNIFMIGARRSEKPCIWDELSEIEIATGSIRKLIPLSAKWSINDCFALNGRVIFAGNRNKYYGVNENSSFYTFDEDGGISEFSYFQESMWNSVGTDCALGGSKSTAVHDGRYWFTATLRDHSEILALDEDGFITPFGDRKWGSAQGLAFSSDGLYTVEMRDQKLGEIYLNGEQLSHINDKVLENKYVAVPEKVEYENDGIDLDGWVLYPKDYDPKEKYPAILDVHGGPKTVYGTVFYHEMQVWANRGFFVMFCNPRGGDGRGDEFADIRGKYGTVDFSDIMKFVDTVLERYPAIDPERLGETGGSYGGYMSNWILGHTDRFKAIATQRSISNWVSMWGTSDIGHDFVDDQTGCSMMKGEADEIWKNSPLPYVIENAVTPTLIIHSDQDYRCPIEQGYQLLSALKMKGVESRMVIFHGENHELSRSGRPQGRAKRLEEITVWMEKHTK